MRRASALEDSWRPRRMAEVTTQDDVSAAKDINSPKFPPEGLLISLTCSASVEFQEEIKQRLDQL